MAVAAGGAVGGGGEGAADGTGAEGVIGGAFPGADGTAAAVGAAGGAAAVGGGGAGDLSVARSLIPMALPQLVAPRAALTASVRASLMAPQPSAPVVELVSPMAKLWAQRIRSLPAGVTVPERLIAAPR